MKNNKLNISIALGFIAIVGILIAQLLWTKQAFSIQEKKFSQKAHIALLEVAKKLYEGINHELPSENPVKKIANDYYIVNIENDFDPKILEFYLRTEFQKYNLLTDFEYAIYNCESDEMIYGGLISLTSGAKTANKIYFPKHKNLVYYFAIRFPNQNGFLFESLTFWVVLSMVLILVLLLYCYSIFTLLQQRKYADLQRDFVNNMAHEFKTPLSSILIASNYLKNQQQINDSEKLKKYSQIIVNQGNKLNFQIEKILNLSKSDANSFKLSLEKILIQDILAEAIDNVLIKHPNVKITVDHQESSTEIFIKADRFHAVNMIYNLLENAIKYCVVNPEIQFNISTSTHKIILECCDNGIGILKKDRSRIFNKFEQLHPTTSATKGFGLGLFYVKNICKQHKWSILVRENVSCGSIFQIIIPNHDV